MINFKVELVSIYSFNSVISFFAFASLHFGQVVAPFLITENGLLKVCLQVLQVSQKLYVKSVDFGSISKPSLSKMGWFIEKVFSYSHCEQTVLPLLKSVKFLLNIWLFLHLTSKPLPRFSETGVYPNDCKNFNLLFFLSSSHLGQETLPLLKLTNGLLKIWLFLHLISKSLLRLFETGVYPNDCKNFNLLFFLGFM